MKRKSVGEKKIRGEDEKRSRALKRHRLSADETKIDTHHISIKLNTLAYLKKYGFQVAPN
jgi:hypothetical protein